MNFFFVFILLISSAFAVWPSDFIGRWKYSSGRNYDEYLKAVGVGETTRKSISNAKPAFEIKQDGDNNFQFIQSSSFKNTHFSFKLGQEYDETTLDGRNVKSTVKFENGKFVNVQKNRGGEDSTMICSLEGGKLITLLRSGSKVARLEFTRQII